MPAPPAFRLSAETCRLARWPQERQALAAAKSLPAAPKRRGGGRLSFLPSCCWAVRPPAREEEGNAEWQKRQPPAFPTHHPKSAKRTRVLLNTPQSTGLVSITLHKAGSLLRENQNPF